MLLCLQGSPRRRRRNEQPAHNRCFPCPQKLYSKALSYYGAGGGIRLYTDQKSGLGKRATSSVTENPAVAGHPHVPLFNTKYFCCWDWGFVQSQIILWTRCCCRKQAGLNRHPPRRLIQNKEKNNMDTKSARVWNMQRRENWLKMPHHEQNTQNYYGIVIITIEITLL